MSTQHDPYLDIDSLIVAAFLRPGDTVLDAGAHRGHATRLFLKSGAGLVYAFEPLPNLYADLSSISDNRLVAYQLALSSSSGKASMYRSISHDQGSSLNPGFLDLFPNVYGETPQTIDVSLTTLDEILPDAKLDFLKLDVEGSEREVLLGAVNVLKNHPPRIMQMEIQFPDISPFVEAGLKHFRYVARAIIDRTSGRLALVPVDSCPTHDYHIMMPPTYVFSNQDFGKLSNPGHEPLVFNEIPCGSQGLITSNHQVINKKSTAKRIAKRAVNFYRRLCGTYGVPQELARIQNTLDGMCKSLQASHAQMENLNRELIEMNVTRELYQRDAILILDRIAHFIPRNQFRVETDHPVALESNDHNFPFGTSVDNTRRPRFVRACEDVFGRDKILNYLDLGCAGGGLVLDFLLRGHRAVGLEGSDYSYLEQRAEWRILRDSLFTCDITHPFKIHDLSNDARAQFDIITAWEVLEHLTEDSLPRLFGNISQHLNDDGLFIGSVGTFHSANPKYPDVVYHTIDKGREWWSDQFSKFGFQLLIDNGFLRQDFCRGVSDWKSCESYFENPELGFHFVARKAQDSSLSKDGKSL